MLSPSVGCMHQGSSASSQGAHQRGRPCPSTTALGDPPSHLVQANPASQFTSHVNADSGDRDSEDAIKTTVLQDPQITVIHRFANGAGAGGCLQVGPKYNVPDRYLSSAFSCRTPKVQHRKEFALDVSHGHQKVKEFAKSAFSPSNKALVLYDSIRDICNTEPILDMASHRHSRFRYSPCTSKE